MNTQDIRHLISLGESLTTEFKSDLSKLPDNDLVAAVVGLANTQGGYLIVGIEDNGKITGLHKKHQNMQGLASLIASRTVPSLSVKTEQITVNSLPIAIIYVPSSNTLVATSDGLIQRRRLKADGSPESIPFHPHEFMQRQSTLGVIDPSAIPMMDISSDALDPLQRQRLRNAIKRYGGDNALAALDDEQLDGALRLVIEVEGNKHPTLTGLLFLGTVELLRDYLPSHEVAFQVLNGTNVKVNEFFKKPLLETFEEVELLFRARVTEEEIQIGLFRTPIPNYDRQAFREAFVNALVHRDYHRLGMVQVKLDDTGLTISSAGGFVEGVNLNNLLVVAPRSRNPLLADVMKRIGLAERTGRGIDRIYEGMLRYGRPAPDYSMSDTSAVSLYMANAGADVEFVRMIVEQEERTGNMPIDSLIILSRLRDERRLTTAELIPSIQKPETQVRSVLGRLTETGLIEAHGQGRGRSYTLSSRVYKELGEQIKYVRQTGADAIQQEQMIISFVRLNGSIRRADVMDLCKLDKDRASRLLKNMKKNNLLELHGRGGNAHYTAK
ncbi:RNA-binding domain-containing protein [Psychrobacter glacincola]|uniref:RNA-binding domain-containing protein n=1 Tax=Psychrobacter glacincola TaxID=56810 RepID=A0ABW1W681_9GAMM|nr:RNA-binding domain-containing protein [Psychrobacter glacincola]